MVRATDPVLAKAAAIIPVEVALIGAVLSWDVEIPRLAADEFFLDGHRLIWGAILNCEDRGEPPRLRAIGWELHRLGQLDKAGGPAKLALCFEEGHIPAYVPALARQVRDAARERALHQLGEQLRAKGMHAEDVARQLEELPGSLTEVAFDPAINWQRIVEGWKVGRVKSGLPSMDAVTAGFARGSLVAIGGRTSHGKTALACHLARALIVKGTRVHFLTLEETDDEIQQRMIAAMIQVPQIRLSSGELSGSEFTAAEDAVRTLQGLPLVIRGLATMRSLDEEHVVASVAASDAEVVILDHLQKVITGGESRVYGIERFLNRLHAVALRHGRVVIVTAQLSRDMDIQKRPPELRDLRDSGAVEQNARQVWLLYWRAKHDRNAPADDYAIHVAKNSGGGTGIVDLCYHAPTGRFSEREDGR